MRRLLSTALVLLTATAALAGTPFFLDRDGVLWTVRSDQQGLVLTGTREGETVAESTVPFPVAIAGSIDRQFQVVADELTGKVAVVWERQWSEAASEIMTAVYNDGSWEEVLRLSGEISSRPRFPAAVLTRVSTPITDESDPDFGAVVDESFIHIMWWEGNGASQHAAYALLRLAVSPGDPYRLLVRDLDTLTPVGLSCEVEPPESVLEHPLFAASGRTDAAKLFYGSSSACLFSLTNVTLVLDGARESDGDGGITVVAQRRRHRPVFGVSAAFPISSRLPLGGARVVVGKDLSPVVYRVVGDELQYVVATPRGWSDLRTLAIGGELSVDKAIPLVESLAR